MLLPYHLNIRSINVTIRIIKLWDVSSIALVDLLNSSYFEVDLAFIYIAAREQALCIQAVNNVERHIYKKAVEV